MSKDTVFSGVQPTGEIHLGNYLGAIKQFLKLQNDSDSIFCIVDQHAITVFQSPEELKDSTLNVLAIFFFNNFCNIFVGIDASVKTNPKVVAIFGYIIPDPFAKP